MILKVIMVKMMIKMIWHDQEMQDDVDSTSMLSNIDIVDQTALANSSLCDLLCCETHILFNL